MRLRVNDYGFNRPIGTNPVDYVAYLDGKLQEFCFEADDKRGYVKNNKVDDNGLMLSDDNSNPITETLYGNVEFKKIV